MSDTQILSTLAQCPYFRGIPTDALHGLSMVGHVEVRRPGEVISGRLSAAESVWIIGTGRVEVRRPQAWGDQKVELAVSILKPGMIFGHVSLLAEVPNGCSWVAAAPTQLVRFDRAAFESLLRDQSTVGGAFRRAMVLALGNQLKAVNDRLAEFVYDPAGEAAEREELLRRAIEGAGATHG